MAGTVFIKTENLARIVEFYTGAVGISVWLEQFDVTILRHESLLLGFQQHSTSDTAEVINLFDPDVRRRSDA